MRYDVHKYLILGSHSVKSRFFAEVQRLGIVEFIGKKVHVGQHPEEVQVFIDALHILRQMAPVKQAEVTENFRSANVLARHVIEVNDQLEQLREHERILQKEIQRIAIFGHFSLTRLKEIERDSGRVIQFFVAKKAAELPAKSRPEVIFIDSTMDMDYFVAINKEKTTYEGFIEIIIEQSLNELEADLAQTVRSIDNNEVDLGALTHRKKLLQEGLVNALNQHHLEESKDASEDFLGKEIFAVESWVPENKIVQLQALANRLDLHIEPLQIEKEDRVPTYLENKNTSALGQDLVNIYDTPSTKDRDPSGWVFFSFAVFFSMIVADAGYGLLLLSVSLYLFFKYGKLGGLGRRVILLSCALSVGCIFWGAMTSSFLGIEVAVNSPVRSISIVNWMVKKKAEYVISHKPDVYDEWVKEFPALQKETTGEQFLLKGVKEKDNKKKYVIYDRFTDNVMMELALFVGAIHIILSFCRYLDRNWSGLGWIIFMVGGYLYFPLVLKAYSLIHYVFHVPYQEGGQIGLYLIFGGIGLATILALIQNKLAGAGEIMQVIGVFADVMSYLRIYALSLAGMIMGSTFNGIGTSLPLYIGIFIILAGHTVNFTLALMGGLIHGLRLNFIEWYHYSFEGGGKSFSPLALLKIH